MPRLVVNPACLDDNSLEWPIPHLIGAWRDVGLVNAASSYYEVSRSKTRLECFDVRTRRNSGDVIMTDNLIRAERITNGWSRIIWGRRCDKVFEAVEVATSSIVWRRDNKEFRWRRDGQ